jgi:hypothetical protein
MTVQIQQQNPRYGEYARAHGKTFEEMASFWQRVADGEEPNPPFDRFPIWHSARVHEFASQWSGCRTLSDVTRAVFDKWYISVNRDTTPMLDVHAVYETWLRERVDALLKESAA